MKATGVVRPIDALGRIVLPIELRRKMDINTGDSLEIFVDKDSVILKKFTKSCVFCSASDEVLKFKENYVCRECLKDIREI